MSNNVIISFLDVVVEKLNMKQSQVAPTINNPLESSHQYLSSHNTIHKTTQLNTHEGRKKEGKRKRERKKNKEE